MADINDLKDICISSGTLRAEDLLPRFMGILKDYAPEKFNEFIKGYPELDGWEDFLEADWRIISDDTKMNASDELFGLLNDIAPEGTMFSSTEGDGSDFGFWTVEEKLLDDDEGEKALKKLQGSLSQYKGKTTGQIAADIRYDVATALDMAADKAEDLMTKFGLDKIYVLRAQGLSPKAIAKKILKACESKDEGWLGGFYSRQDVLDAMDGGILNKDWKLEKRFGNWGCYVNQNTGRPLVLQVMVSQDRNGDWGYKPVTSDMGPVDTNIQAAKWLKPRLEEWVEKNPDLAKDVPDYEWGWIEKCLGKETANKDRKNLVSSLVKGDKIKLIDTVADGAVVTFIDMITPTKMRILHNGREMSCKTSFIDRKVEESKSEAKDEAKSPKEEVKNVLMGLLKYPAFCDKISTAGIEKDINRNIEALRDAFLGSLDFQDGSFKYDVTVEDGKDGEVDHGPMFDACASVTDKILEILGLPGSVWNAVQEYLFYEGVDENIVSEAKKSESSGAALASIYGDGDVSTHENSADGFYVDEHDPMGFAVLNNDTATMEELFSGKAVAPEKPWTYAGWHEDIDAPENKDGSYPYVYDWEREYDLNFVNDWKRVVGDKNNEKALELLLKYAPDFIPSAMDFWNAFHAGYSKGLLRKLFDNIFAVVDKDDPNNNYLGYEDYTYDEVAKFLGDKDEAAQHPGRTDFEKALQKRIDDAKGTKYDTKDFIADGWEFVTGDVYDAGSEYGSAGKDVAVAFFKREQDGQYYRMWLAFDPDTKEITGGKWWIESDESKDERRDSADYLQEVWDALVSVWDKEKFDMAKGYDDEYECEAITIASKYNEDVHAKIYVDDHEGKHPVGFDVIYRYPGDKGVGDLGYYEFQSTDFDEVAPEIFAYFDELKGKVGEAKDKFVVGMMISLDGVKQYIREIKPRTFVGQSVDTGKEFTLPLASLNRANVLFDPRTSEKQSEAKGDNWVAYYFCEDPQGLEWAVLPHAINGIGNASCVNSRGGNDSIAIEYVLDKCTPIEDVKGSGIYGKVKELEDRDIVALTRDEAERIVLADDRLKELKAVVAPKDESKNEDLNTAKDFVYSIAPIGILVRQAGQPGFKGVKNSDDHIIVGFMRHDNTRFIIDWDADKKQGTATRQVMVDDKDALYGYKWVTPKSNANVTFTTREELKDFVEGFWDNTSSESKNESLTLKQKELKDMARYGEAEDITTISDAEAKELKKKGIETVGVSRGTYGMNGALLRDREGNKYVITARSSNLFYFV